MGMTTIPEHVLTPPTTQAATTVTAQGELMTVKVADVGLQTSGVKLTLIDDATAQQGRVRYLESEGGDPPYAEAPTREQITVFLARLRRLITISLDFAVFVPYGDRALQARFFDAMAFNMAGQLCKVRLNGPPSFK